jgi:phosphatidylserine decarboxylase
MKIHKEGIEFILVTFLVLLVINLILYFALKKTSIPSYLVGIASVIFFALVIYFFRSPHRKIELDNTHLLSPADGKVVVIEKISENEYFNDERLKISIFMSPLNVHVNRYPISGEVTYCKYHPGKYLVAFHPKSSELNERATLVIKDKERDVEILVRQIAGAVARRIVTYSKEGDKAIQGEELGFIKFGSRVDIFMPVDTKLLVKLGDKVKGNMTTIADLSGLN